MTNSKIYPPVMSDVEGVLPMFSGGTGASSAVEALKNLSVLQTIGYNLPESISNDTSAYWKDQPSGVYYYSVDGLLHGQPSQYGHMLNIHAPNSGMITQIFSTLSGNTLAVRHANGSTTDMPDFVPILKGGTVPVVSGGTGVTSKADFASGFWPNIRTQLNANLTATPSNLSVLNVSGFANAGEKGIVGASLAQVSEFVYAKFGRVAHVYMAVSPVDATPSGSALFDLKENYRPIAPVVLGSYTGSSLSVRITTSGSVQVVGGTLAAGSKLYVAGSFITKS